MAQWVDLKPDRRLLDSEFEGYRLSLDKLECSGKQLNKGECFFFKLKIEPGISPAFLKVWSLWLKSWDQKNLWC